MEMAFFLIQSLSNLNFVPIVLFSVECGELLDDLKYIYNYAFNSIFNHLFIDR